RQANKADVYWDGKLVKSYTTDDNGKGEDLILNIGAGSYPMYGAAGAMQVDYVRVWKGGTGVPVGSATLAPVTATPTSVPLTATTVKLPTASPIVATPTPASPKITASPTSLLPTTVPVSTQTAFVPTPTATQIIVNNPTAIPTFTAVPVPSDSFVSVSVSPQSMVLGETGLAAVNLNNVPVQGYRSAEFTCTYPNDQLEISNILISNLFGPDPVSAINGPQNGSFIIAIAGSNGNRITVNGAVFTFNVKALQAGQINIDCKARISKGDNSLEGISYVPGTINSVSNLPTATQLSAPVLTGQVIAAKPVIIRLFNLDASLAVQANTNTDGTFSLTAPAGTYTVIASADGFLDAQGSVTLVDGVNTMMPVANLPAGDIDNNDVIDQFDAMTIGMSYNTPLPVAADLNSNDGVIDVLDLEVLSENYRKSGALSWQ
ncbi:MAG: carboxypeptidase regulatory-like domain-containing protein, partial [Anaerolineales bacterium]|nr:carboxypeptidase regulatory-like domain-containing protein [Anaerolineales bacterium]